MTRPPDSSTAPHLYGPSLFWRLLVANLTIVLGGALLATMLARLFAMSGRFTPLTHTLMVLAAIALSAALTALILRLAFQPLRALRRAIAEAEATGGLPGTSRLAGLNLGRFGDPDIVAVAGAVRDLWTRLDHHVRLLEEKGAALERAAALVVAAQEDERRRLARELHDGTLQSLAALVMGLERGLSAMPEDVPHLRESHRTVARLKDVAVQTLDEVRQLALNLRPAVLDDHGLSAALRWLAQTHEERTGIRVSVDVGSGVDADPSARLPTETETALFRIAQEALANVAKHAGAQTVSLRLARDDAAITLQVQDDGVGLQNASAPATNGSASSSPPDAHLVPAGGMGLFSMRERAALLGGACAIMPSPSGRGTLVRAEIPVRAHPSIPTASIGAAPTGAAA